MHQFKRRGGMISSDLNADEVELLESLLHELIDLIDADGGGTPSTEASPRPRDHVEDDPFAAWAEELAGDDPVQPPEDPVLRRLLPDAYPGDPKASAEFRRYTESELRRKKINDAEVALGHLAKTDGGRHDLRIPVDEAEHWLRVLTSLRLAVAGRLGITDSAAADEIASIKDDDPRAFMASVYDWLGFAQETLVFAL